MGEYEMQDMSERDVSGVRGDAARRANTMMDIAFLSELGEAALDGLVDDFGSRGGGYIPQFHGRHVDMATGPYDTFRYKPERSRHHGPEHLLEGSLKNRMHGNGPLIYGMDEDKYQALDS